MEPTEKPKSALDVAREARKKHESVEGSYRDGTYRAIADIVRTVALFEKDDPGYENLQLEPFFDEIEKKIGRKRDTSNRYNTLGRYIFNADTRSKEQTVNLYANVARYLAEKGVPPETIPEKINEAHGIKELAKRAAEERKLQAAVFEDETWNDLVALKIWVSPKHLRRAMKVEIGQEAGLRFKRVEGTSDFKQFVCGKLERIQSDEE